MPDNSTRKTRKRKKSKATRRRALRRLFYLLVLLVCLIVIAVAVTIIKSSGTFESRSEVTVFSLKQDGTIVFEEVETIPTEYKASEFKDFAKEQVSEYKTKGGTGVTLERVAVDGQEVYSRIKYHDAGAYKSFTGYECFNGTIASAMSYDSKFDFTGTFLSADYNFDQAKTVNMEEVLQDTSSKVLILAENVDVSVEGELLYVSSEGTKVSNKIVSIMAEDGNLDAPPLVYIIYK